MMVTWEEAENQFVTGHLVSGYHDPDRLDRLRQIEKLLAAMPPKGRFAARNATVRGERCVQIQFQGEADANALGDAVKARQQKSEPPHKTSRWFEYTPLVFRVITNTLKGERSNGREN